MEWNTVTSKKTRKNRRPAQTGGVNRPARGAGQVADAASKKFVWDHTNAVGITIPVANMETRPWFIPLAGLNSLTGLRKSVSKLIGKTEKASVKTAAQGILSALETAPSSVRATLQFSDAAQRVAKGQDLTPLVSAERTSSDAATAVWCTLEDKSQFAKMADIARSMGRSICLLLVPKPSEQNLLARNTGGGGAQRAAASGTSVWNRPPPVGQLSFLDNATGAKVAIKLVTSSTPDAELKTSASILTQFTDSELKGASVHPTLLEPFVLRAGFGPATLAYYDQVVNVLAGLLAKAAVTQGHDPIDCSLLSKIAPDLAALVASDETSRHIRVAAFRAKAMALLFDLDLQIFDLRGGQEILQVSLDGRSATANAFRRFPVKVAVSTSGSYLVLHTHMPKPDSRLADEAVSAATPLAHGLAVILGVASRMGVVNPELYFNESCCENITQAGEDDRVFKIADCTVIDGRKPNALTFPLAARRRQVKIQADKAAEQRRQSEAERARGSAARASAGASAELVVERLKSAELERTVTTMQSTLRSMQTQLQQMQQAWSQQHAQRQNGSDVMMQGTGTTAILGAKRPRGLSEEADTQLEPAAEPAPTGAPRTASAAGVAACSVAGVADIVLPALAANIHLDNGLGNSTPAYSTRPPQPSDTLPVPSWPGRTVGRLPLLGHWANVARTAASITPATDATDGHCAASILISAADRSAGMGVGAHK